MPHVRFEAHAGGIVEAVFQPRVADEGYGGRLHGGVIATLLDAAMTNCLFAHGRCGVTGDLHLRYRHPVVTDGSCVVRAWIERASPPFFVLRAELWQNIRTCVTAAGKFMELPQRSGEGP
jgi:acyl-coenzyme A thioesterase PaaI-like protein